MFAGLKFVLTGGISSKRSQVFAAQIERHGGAVHSVPIVPAIFRKRAAATGSLPEDVTHVLVDKLYRREALAELLGVGSVPEAIKVLSAAWLEQSLANGAIADEQVFSGEHVVGAVESSVLVTSDAGERSAKRQRTNRTAATAAMQESTQPFGGSDTTPGMWQETESKSCCYMIASSMALAAEAESGAIKVAAFDFDGTLVTPKSGKTHPTAASDWRLWHAEVPRRLQQLYVEGYKIVIFTNQKLTPKGLSRAARVQRIEEAISAMGVQVSVFMAFEDDIFRKPCPGMWDLFSGLLGREMDLSESFFVGDAAGRPASGGRKKDFSASDRKFAHNLGLAFRTPEQFFLGSREVLPELESHPLASADIMAPVEAATHAIAVPVGSPEIVLLYGSPGSGKSVLATTVFAAYTRVNQDTLKTKKKCLEIATDAVQRGNSVVVDNTNRTRDSRREWIELANAHGAAIRCVVVETSKEICFHLNKYRGVSEPGGGRMVPSMVIHSFFKSAELPMVDEGFARVDHWSFRLLLDEATQSKRLLRMYLL